MIGSIRERRVSFGSRWTADAIPIDAPPALPSACAMSANTKQTRVMSFGDCLYFSVSVMSFGSVAAP